VHFTPDIDAGKASVAAEFSDAAPAGTMLRLKFKHGEVIGVGAGGRRRGRAK